MRLTWLFGFMQLLFAVSMPCPPCVSPEQVNCKYSDRKQEVDRVKEQSDDDSSSARLVDSIEVPVKLGCISHWRVGGVGETLKKQFRKMTPNGQIYTLKQIKTGHLQYKEEKKNYRICHRRSRTFPNMFNFLGKISI